MSFTLRRPSAGGDQRLSPPHLLRPGEHRLRELVVVDSAILVFVEDRHDLVHHVLAYGHPHGMEGVTQLSQAESSAVVLVYEPEGVEHRVAGAL